MTPDEQVFQTIKDIDQTMSALNAIAITGAMTTERADLERDLDQLYERLAWLLRDSLPAPRPDPAP